MNRLKLIKFLLVFAALVFIAKPFIAYHSSDLLLKSKVTLILVKAFAKRKPEYLEEAETKKAGIQQQLNNPPQRALLAFAWLLTMLLPLMRRGKVITDGFLDQLSLTIMPSQPAYILGGKLTI